MQSDDLSDRQRALKCGKDLVKRFMDADERWPSFRSELVVFASASDQNEMERRAHGPRRVATLAPPPSFQHLAIGMHRAVYRIDRAGTGTAKVLVRPGSQSGTRDGRATLTVHPAGPGYAIHFPFGSKGVDVPPQAALDRFRELSLEAAIVMEELDAARHLHSGGPDTAAPLLGVLNEAWLGVHLTRAKATVEECDEVVKPLGQQSTGPFEDDRLTIAVHNLAWNGGAGPMLRATISTWGSDGHLWRLDDFIRSGATSIPEAVEKPFGALLPLRWFVSSLRGNLFRGCALAMESMLSATSVTERPGAVSEQTARSSKARRLLRASADQTSCQVEARKRGGGRTAWQIAKERGESYVAKHPFPGRNALARLVWCNVHTIAKAIGHSEKLQRAEVNAKLAVSLAHTHGTEAHDRPTADEVLGILLEQASDSERARINEPESRRAIEAMSPQQRRTLLEKAEAGRGQRTPGARACARAPNGR